MGASATAALDSGRLAAIAKIASAIEGCPDAKAAYNRKYWPNPKEPLHENIARQLGGKAPFSFSIEGLDEVKKDGRATEMLEMLLPDAVDEFFGRETLFWMWKEYRSRESRNRITAYLKGKEMDVRLLERSECAANARAAIALYNILENSQKFVLTLDVPLLVESAAQKSRKNPGAYGVLPMETLSKTGCGWEKTWGEGTKYRIHLDAPVGLGLMHKGVPNAVSSAIPLDADTLLIKQIQGRRPYASTQNGCEKKGGSRGLFGLDWQKLLVDANEKMALFFGFSVLGIQSAANNEWVILEDRNQEAHLKYEAAARIYDETAERLGFARGEGGNFYRAIEKPA